MSDQLTGFIAAFRDFDPATRGLMDIGVRFPSVRLWCVYVMMTDSSQFDCMTAHPVGSMAGVKKKMKVASI